MLKVITAVAVALVSLQHSLATPLPALPQIADGYQVPKRDVNPALQARNSRGGEQRSDYLVSKRGSHERNVYNINCGNPCYQSVDPGSKDIKREPGYGISPEDQDSGFPTEEDSYQTKGHAGTEGGPYHTHGHGWIGRSELDLTESTEGGPYQTHGHVGTEGGPYETQNHAGRDLDPHQPHGHVGTEGGPYQSHGHVGTEGGPYETKGHVGTEGGPYHSELDLTESTNGGPYQSHGRVGASGSHKSNAHFEGGSVDGAEGHERRFVTESASNSLVADTIG